MTSDERTEANRQVMSEYARLVYTERDVATAFERFVAEDYIQHNPGLSDGRAPAAEFLGRMYANPDSTFEVQRILIDGDLAAVHVRAHPVGRPVLAVADFYRLEGGLIVEHWDAIQPFPEQSANDHPMF